MLVLSIGLSKWHYGMQTYANQYARLVLIFWKLDCILDFYANPFRVHINGNNDSLALTGINYLTIEDSKISAEGSVAVLEQKIFSMYKQKIVEMRMSQLYYSVASVGYPAHPRHSLSNMVIREGLDFYCKLGSPIMNNSRKRLINL